MPPVFGPGVAVERALEVLRRAAAARRRCRRSGRTATPRARRGTPRSTTAPGRPGTRRARSASARSSVTTTPLPAASPSSLTTYGGAERVERRVDLVGRRCRRAASAVGTPAAAMTSLANALEPSSAGGRGGRPEAGDTRGPHGVGDAGDQRRLGPDDDEVGAELVGEGGDRGAVERVDRRAAGDRGRCPALPGAACRPVTAGSRAGRAAGRARGRRSRRRGSSRRLTLGRAATRSRSERPDRP